MGKHKKDELDTILEQLKKSIEDDLDDSTLDMEDPEEDTELASVLAKIFADSKETSDRINISTEELKIDNDHDDLIREKTEFDKSSDVCVEEVLTAESSSITDEIKSDEVLETDEEKVDNVLKAMFRGDPKSFTENESTLTDVIPDVMDINPGCDAIEEIIDCPNEACESTASLDSKHENSSIEIIENEKNVTDDGLCDLTYHIGSDSIIYDEDLINNNAPSLSSEITDDHTISENDLTSEDTNIIKSNKITDPNRYIFDDLQQSLSDATFYRPEIEFDFSIANDVNLNELNETHDAIVIESQEEVTDNDISLLMKFGYEGEISANGESERTHDVALKKSKKYIPEKYKMLHGFTGKEYTDKSQASAIKRKFKSEKISLLISAIIVTLFAFVMIATDITLAITNVYYVYIPIMYLFASIIVVLLLAKKLYFGIIALIKFDANQYSLPALAMIEYLLCSAAMNITLVLSSNAYDRGAYISLGGYVLLYVAFAVWSEWIDCVRESSTFNYITDNDTFYVAEKRNYNDSTYFENKRRYSRKRTDCENKYLIKRTEFISGFHQKSTDGKANLLHIVFILGVIPAAAIIAGAITAIFNENFVSGINGLALVLFLSIPLSSTISFSIIEFWNHKNLKKQYNSVCIGLDAMLDISKAESLIFEDTDAIEVTACTAINPTKNVETSQKWLNTARRVFETLGGPISASMNRRCTDESNITHDISINSISDNGIDLYFDSSMNVLIGDKTYMLSHNIKVKTDINLTGAVKGSERTVIYMAFDRIPQIGFIVTCKVKKTFLETVELLSKHHMKVEIRSYEPELNEYYFEINNVEYPITVNKPQNFERTDPSNVSDSNFVSLSSSDLCNAVIYSKKVCEDREKASRIRKVQVIVGFAVACILVSVLCLPSRSDVVAWLQSCVSVLFYIVSLLMIIPNVVQVIKQFIRK